MGYSGNPLTAEDVAWSLYRVMKLNFGLATTWKAYGYSVDNIQSLIRASDAISGFQRIILRATQLRLGSSYFQYAATRPSFRGSVPPT